MVADTETFENMDASEIHPRRINAKGVLTPQRREDFIFPTADGTAELSGRDHEFREPTLRQEQPVESEHLSGDLEGEPKGPQPTETKDDAEARKGFLSIQGDFIYRHHNEPRVPTLCGERRNISYPLNFIDVTRAAFSNLDVLQEKRFDDCWNVDSNRSLFDYWKGFTKFTLQKRKTSKGTCMVREKTDKKFKRPPDLRICGLKFGPKWEKPLRRKKSKNGQTRNKTR